MTLAKAQTEEKLTLVELAEAVKVEADVLEFALCTCDEETIAECEKKFRDIINQLGDKLEACYFASKMLAREADAYKAEADEMNKKAATKKETASRILNLVKATVMNLGTYQGEKFKFTVCNNSTSPVWRDLEDEANIPDEFVAIETVHHVDWKAIEKLAKDSPDGCVYGKNGKVIAKVLPRGKHVRIR